MDLNEETEQGLELDQLMQRASASVQQSLDAAVDVKQRLRDLLCDAGVDPGLTPTEHFHR